MIVVIFPVDYAHAGQIVDDVGFVALRAISALIDCFGRLGFEHHHGRQEHPHHSLAVIQTYWQVKSLPQGCRLTVS
jgi:hypothetical protein